MSGIESNGRIVHMTVTLRFDDYYTTAGHLCKKGYINIIHIYTYVYYIHVAMLYITTTTTYITRCQKKIVFISK